MRSKEGSAHREAAAPIGRPGHNTGFRVTSQWQDPKAEEGPQSRPADHDLDLVEQEFHRLASTSTDPTST